jgi:hypothetical protein
VGKTLNEFLITPVAEAYLRAQVIKDIELITTTVANADFEQGFLKAKALAITAAKGKV